MDSFGAYAEGEWDLCGSILSLEELDLTPYFVELQGLNSSLASYPTPQADACVAGMSDDTWFCSLDSSNNNVPCVFGASPSHQDNHRLSNSIDRVPHFAVADDRISTSTDAGVTSEEKNMGSIFSACTDILFEEITDFSRTTEDRCGNIDIIDTHQAEKAGTPAKESHQKRKLDVPEDDKVNNTCSSSEIPSKKIRASRNVQKNRKPTQSNKCQLKLSTPRGKCEEKENAGSDLHSCSSYNSEDDNTSQETNGGAILEAETSPALNLNGKMRANRGSATDPQSLYARKRRERINERLRILQKLVPNGTKVDISTMLEEAVHYVKFLQLQIKLLSSDDLWMYAPIAYNGMDIGLQQKLSSFL